MIYLPDIPVICITIPSAKDRHARIQQFIDEKGFKRFQFLHGEVAESRVNYCVKVAETHKEAYTIYKPPFIVIEDDCVATRHYTNEIPDPTTDPGAIYLGTSRYGMIQGKTQYEGAIASYTQDDFYIRPYNMLGQHAILFLNDAILDQYTNLLNLSIQQREGSDNNIARQMKHLNVIACAAPMLYQQDGHSDSPTHTPILPQF